MLLISCAYACACACARACACVSVCLCVGVCVRDGPTHQLIITDCSFHLGYARLSDVFVIDDWLQIKLRFKTTSPEGVLFAIGDPGNFPKQLTTQSNVLVSGDQRPKKVLDIEVMWTTTQNGISLFRMTCDKQ